MRMLITGGLVARADGVFNTDILIEGDRILELGERLHEARQPEGTEIVDVSGCVVARRSRRPYPINLTVGDSPTVFSRCGGGTRTDHREHPGFGPQGCDHFISPPRI
ncbi:MAG: hypothetical protein ACLSTO_03690 [Bilophila wadsworthia]